MSAHSVCFRTDDAWDFIPGERSLRLPAVDVREEARCLRFVTSASRIDAFAAKHAPDFRPYTLFGSGDFHHLSAVWQRQFNEPFTLLSFDNHPDWDIRPPRWSCGAWINRALENPRLQSASVWGCGNFECNFPWRFLGNRRAAKTHRLLVYPWRQRRVRYPAYFNPLRIGNWKTMFRDWLDHHHGHKIYVTIDLDCLTSTDAVTNWEAGKFTIDDLVWALHALHEKMHVIGGDLCGAWSKPAFAGLFQRFASWWDHPKKKVDPARRFAVNEAALQCLWPALTGR